MKAIVKGLFLLVGVLLLLSNNLLAQDVWDGGGDGTTWSDDNNWVDDTAPDGESVTIGNFTTVVDGSFLNSITSLTINDAGGSVAIGAQTLTVTGDVTGSGTVTIGAGTLTAGGTVDVSTLTCSDAATIEVGGDWGVSSFTSSTSTVDFNGTGAQSLSTNTTFGFLQSTKTGGTLTLDANAIQVNRDLTINGSGGTFDAQDCQVTVRRDFFITAGTFDADQSTFIFDSQTFDSHVYSNGFDVDFFGITYSQTTSDGVALTLTNAGGGSITFTINGTLLINGSSAFNVSIGTGTGTTLEYGATSTLSYGTSSAYAVGSEWPTNSDPQTVELISSARVDYTGDHAVDFLVIDGGGTLQLDSGTLTINSSGSLEIQDGIFDLNGGSVSYSSGSTLVYNAASEYTVGDEWSTTVTPANVSIQNAGAELVTNYTGQTLSVGPDGGAATDGDIRFNATLRHDDVLEVRGDVIGGSGDFGVADNGELQLIDTEDQNIDVSNTFTVQNLTVNKTGGVASIIAGATLRLDANTGNSLLYIQAGTLSFDVNAANLSLINGTVNDHNIQVDNGATFATGGKSISNFDNYTLGATSTISFTGNSSETVPAGTYGNLTVDNGTATSEVTLGGAVTLQVGSDLTVTSGRLSLGGNTVTKSGTNDLVVGASGVLRTANAAGTSAATALTGFSNYLVSGEVVFNGNTGNETLPSGLSGEAFDLTVNKSGGGVIMEGAVVYGGSSSTLTMTNGDITTTGVNILTLAAGTQVSATTASHINGPVRRQFDNSFPGDVTNAAYDIPVGNGTDYRPVKLEFNNLSAGTETIEAQMVGSDPITSNDPPSGYTDTYDSRYWSIVETAAATYDDANLVLDYNGYSVAAPNNVRIIQGPDADGANYSLAGTYDSRTGTEVTHLGISDFSTNILFAFAVTQATKTWVASGSGNWNTDANWSDGVQPSPGDIVILDNSGYGSGYTVTLNTAESVGQLTITPTDPNQITLLISGSSLTISGTGTVLTLDALATLTINGPSGDAINMSGGGDVQFNNASTYNLQTGSGIANAGSRTFGATSQTAISSTNSSALKDEAYGLLTVSNASGQQSVSGNMSAQTFTMTGNGGVYIDGDLTVAGAFDKSAGTGTLTVTNGAFSTGTTLSISTGTVTVSGTGSLSQGTTLTNGGTLNLNGSTQSDLTGGTVTNTSNLTINGTGGALFAAMITSGIFTVSDGDVSWSGTISKTGTLAINAGAGTIGMQALTNTSGAVNFVNSNAVTVSGAYSGAGTISATGTGDITFESTFSLAGNATFGAQNLALQGDVNVSAGTFRPSTNTTFTGADLQISGDGAISNTAGKITFALAGGQTVTDNSTAAVTMYDIDINKASGNLTLNAPVSIAHGLTLTDGNIVTTGTNLLTFTSGATDDNVSEGSNDSFIDGPAAKISSSTATFTFPVGDGGKWRRLRIEPNGPSTVTYTAEFFNDDPNAAVGDVLNGLNNISTQEYWSLVRNAAINANVRLFWEDESDGVDGAVSDLRVAQWDQTATEWTDQGGTPTDLGGGAGYITAGGITNFGTGANIYFTLGSETGDNSLPVELASFEAVGNYGNVTLNWVTASEIENLGFNVYRAVGKDGAWEKANAEMIEGRGNSSEESSYQFVDANVAAGETYSYKLESVSLNGVVEVEKTVEVVVPVPQEYALFNNYPNPFNPTTNLKFQLPENSLVSVNIYDVTGKLIKRIANNKSYPAGEFVVQWDATDQFSARVASGMYVYHFRAGNFSKVGKMVLLK